MFGRPSISTTGSANSTTVTFAKTVGSGANRLLLVGVSIHANQTVVSITYSGVALTPVARLQNGDWGELWRLVAPPSGTANVVVTIRKRQFTAGAISFTGVDQAAGRAVTVAARYRALGDRPEPPGDLVRREFPGNHGATRVHRKHAVVGPPTEVAGGNKAAALRSRCRGRRITGGGEIGVTRRSAILVCPYGVDTGTVRQPRF
jgi:hypothetical protein